MMIMTGIHRRNGLKATAWAVMVGTLLLNACTPVPPGGDTGVSGTEPSGAAEPGKPDHAFLIEDGLYAVPLAVDGEGCEEFTTWSGSAVQTLQQPIYYHDGKGAFSTTKDKDVACNATMVKTGIDVDECPTYRAEQPDGFTSGVIYYPSGQGFTARKERSTCR